MDFQGLHCYIDHLAVVQPDVPASLEARTGASWSYQQLHRASLRVAALLAPLLAENGDIKGRPPRPAALGLPRGNAWYACCYACWRLGVPVVANDEMPDKASQAQRAERLAKELRPRVAIGFATKSMPNDCVSFSMEHILAAIETGTEASKSGPLTGPDSVLLYTYTGGTTKHSKCVVVSHAMALWELQNYHIVMQGHVSSADRVLQFTSAYWGAAAFGQIDIALAFGACVVFSDPEAEKLAPLIAKHEISVLGTVPSLLRATYPGGPESKAPSLKVILTWGEALSVKVSKPWRKVCFLVDLLIASEYWLALYSHCDVYRDPATGREKHLLIPLPKLQMHLLNDGLVLPNAPGNEGEMILTGATVSPGYITDGFIGPSESTEHSDYVHQGVRYLRTRDKLRWVSAKRLVYCGRTGSLAKKGGQFVDLEELSERLQALPGMLSCAILGGERLEAFCTLEEELTIPLQRVQKEAQKICGPTARVHFRTQLPRHPVTGKVDRLQLQAQLDTLLQRELTYEEQKRWIQRQMLRAYCSWYPVALLYLVWATLVGGFLDLKSLWSIPLRLLLLPYMWGALAYTPLLPLSSKRERAAYESCICPPELLLILVGVLPSFLLCTAQVWACALLVCVRRERVAALPMLAVGVVSPFLPLATQLSLCGGCIIWDLMFPHDDRFLLPSLPLCFYLVLPKWLGDELTWHLEKNFLRRRLKDLLIRFFIIPKIPWAASWAWEDHGRSFSILDSVGPVRVAKGNSGLSLAVEFSEEIQVPCARRAADVDEHASSASPSTAVGDGHGTLATLVARAGGDPSMLRLDSLQATVLAELIRKELHQSISVADVLRSQSLQEMQQRCGPCEEVNYEEEHGETFRVFLLQFPRHPVDWCLRVDAPIDLHAFQRAVDRCVAQHSALRTSETPDEALRDTMDKAAALWQLWRAVGRRSDCWERVMASALFALWPRTRVARSEEAPRLEVRVPPLVDGRVRDPRWDWASHDQYIHSVFDDLLKPRRWPFDVAVAPLFHGTAAGHSAIEAALSKPASEVAWYIYCSITHAYSDGLSGQALFADLLRFYHEERETQGGPSSAAKEELGPTPEPLALLQRRLWRSLCKPGNLPEPNDDLYHESICDDWGRRAGQSRRIYFHPNVTRTLRLAARHCFGCSVDLAWLTAIMCTMFRLFPQQPRMLLILKASCRDGPGQGQMVGFLSEARLIAVDAGDLATANIWEVHKLIDSARLARDWRAPEPFEFGLCVYVNIVSAMVDSLPPGYRHLVREAAPPSRWYSTAYSHLNLRIDQLQLDDWDFRIFHHDSAWGWDWPTNFAHDLADTVRRMALTPTAPVVGDLGPVERSGAAETGSSKRSAEIETVERAAKLRRRGGNEG
ncbi:unnamed protein product [Durusdinium trenchii]|uniref:AMP-dependent synthetase/ligase domain-containing protein n=1 Tax=Durusdinium trenchii TaxID=1381693 RepID=A0ABP0L920_9DINO